MMKKTMEIAGWGCTVSFYVGILGVVGKEVEMTKYNMLLLGIALIFFVCASVYIYGMIREIKSFLINGPVSLNDTIANLRKAIDRIDQERREILTANNNYYNRITGDTEKIMAILAKKDNLPIE